MKTQSNKLDTMGPCANTKSASISTNPNNPTVQTSKIRHFYSLDSNFLKNKQKLDYHLRFSLKFTNK